MTDLPTITPESRMLIDGKLVDSSTGERFDVINPANQAFVGAVADGSAADMQAAISAARRAFDESDWSTDRELRKRCLGQLQDALDREVEELREQIIQEVGSPRMLTHSAQLDVPLESALRYPIKMIDEYAWEVDLGEAIGIQGNLDHRKVVSMPAGVVGAITPWNFPFEVVINKLAQALATGNTIVLKPAPDTPLNATLLGRLIAEQTDIPAGVVNIVTSSDHSRGEQLTLSPEVDLISFTGSTAVGQRIMEKGAATLKRLFLELGGKSATIVLDDADLVVASFMGLAVCTHSGQGCAIPTRMLLPRSRYDEGLELLVDMMKNVPYGDPQRPDVLQGPLISEKQRQRVLGYIEKGKEEGARLVLGGGVPTGEEFDKGFFVEPTLFADVDNSMTIAQEEIFGPVLVVIPFDDDDDAVRIANDSRYGLGGGVMAGTHERAMAVADRIRTGMLSINGGGPYGADLPFGGFKYSGVGRQNGIAGFDQYLELKSYALAGVVTAASAAAELNYDPFDFDIDDDPYPIWKRLRDESPLYYNERYDFFALSRFHDVEDALKNWKSFSSGKGTLLELIKADIELPPGTFIFEDPPAHDLHRGLMSRVFTPRRMAAIEPDIRAFCARSLDPLIGSDGFDVIADLGAQIPMRTIGMLLGIPESEQAALRDQIDDGLKLAEGGEMPSFGEGSFDELGQTALFEEYIDYRYEKPGDDVMTDLITAEYTDVDGVQRRLTREEALGYINLVAAAGNETTNRLIGWTTRLLGLHPDERRAVAADRSLVNNTIEEVLRYESPSPVQARYVMEDVELHGTTVPEGATILLLNGSGNRDERAFDDPDRFDVRRDIAHHLAFGYGIHFCLGAALARIEGRVVLDEMLNRFPDWEIDEERAVRGRTSTVRGWASMPVRL